MTPATATKAPVAETKPKRTRIVRSREDRIAELQNKIEWLARKAQPLPPQHEALILTARALNRSARIAGKEGASSLHRSLEGLKAEMSKVLAGEGLRVTERPRKNQK